MIEILVNKTLFVLFFISILNILRHLWKVFSILRNDDVPNKYELSKQELIFLGLSVAYVLTTIFTKITI
jgi:hypothetical protein